MRSSRAAMKLRRVCRSSENGTTRPLIRKNSATPNGPKLNQGWPTIHMTPGGAPVCGGENETILTTSGMAQ